MPRPWPARASLLLGIAAAASFTVAAEAQHGSQTIMGLPQLIERLGSLTPTGETIIVAEIEAPNGDGHYGPNVNNADFVGKSFFEMSGPTGTSSHATTVGKFLFGLPWSLAPGIDQIYLYSAPGWLTADYLRTQQPGSVAPLLPPADIRIMNHSWVGSIGADTNVALQRADFAAARDRILMVAGVNNGPPAFGLMSHMYNGLAVGLRNGTHVTSDTLPGLDGPGRMKPEIVAPDNFTSFATPMVGAAAALLFETAQTWPTLIDDADARRTEVVKVALLAGAVRENQSIGTWSNNPVSSGPQRGLTTRPIDDVVGAGTVNIDRSHRILTGGRVAASDQPVAPPALTAEGWDLVTMPVTSSAYWRLRLSADAPEIGIITTWNRRSRLPFPSTQVANIDLHLWHRAADGTLLPLLGDDGLPFFSSGNVVSASLIDNIEMLVVRDLAPGDYVVEARRVDSVAAPFATFDVALGWMIPEHALALPEDLNGDGVVDFADLLVLLSAWGTCDGCLADLNGDDLIDFTDLLILLSAWGD